jgi:hypothetical protein
MAYTCFKYMNALARECILFRGVPDLLRCLEALVADPEVELLRVRNRLSPAHDAADSAGYRSVGGN